MRNWHSESAPTKSPEMIELERQLALAKPVWDLLTQSQKDRMILLDSKVNNIGDLFCRLAKMSQAEKKKD